jgi:hypothetical protein
MTDIVERLRNWKHAAMRRDGSTLATMGEAADEIERLRAERDALSKKHLKAEERCDLLAQQLAAADGLADERKAKANDYDALARHQQQTRLELDALRELLGECRDELEYWTPDETTATVDESEALNGYYALRDRIDAARKGGA